MAIQLYKAGDTHEVRGVKCEVGNFDIGELDTQLKNGWVANEQDLIEESTAEEVNPVRQAAKEKGIEGWETKRLNTLQAAIDAA